MTIQHFGIYLFTLISASSAQQPDWTSVELEKNCYITIPPQSKIEKISNVDFVIYKVLRNESLLVAVYFGNNPDVKTSDFHIGEINELNAKWKFANEGKGWSGDCIFELPKGTSQDLFAHLFYGALNARNAKIANAIFRSFQVKNRDGK